MGDSIFGPGLLLSLFQAGDSGVNGLLIQLAVIQQVAGELATRFLKVGLAELGAGVLIGPFALGGISLLGVSPLFPLPLVDGIPAPIPVSNELYALAQIGSIVLLFAIGLETNLRQFLRYAGPASAVALGGVLLPFILGAGATVLLGYAGPEGFLSPEALFMGAIMTATSVGITARVLADLNRLDNPEGSPSPPPDVVGMTVVVHQIGFKLYGFDNGLVLTLALALLGKRRLSSLRQSRHNGFSGSGVLCGYGKLVDVGSMQNAVVFGLIISALAVLSKVLGSGIPALLSGFNLRGSSRTGLIKTRLGKIQRNPS